MNPKDERKLLIKINSLPLDFTLSGNERACRRWSDLLLYGAEGGEGWRVFLRRTYLEILTYHEAYWELIASDTGSGGYSEPRGAPIVAVAVIPVLHMHLDGDRLIYVSPEDGREEELHPTRCIRFSGLLKDGEKITDEPDTLVKRAIRRILPDDIAFEFQSETATFAIVDTVM